MKAAVMLLAALGLASCTKHAAETNGRHAWTQASRLRVSVSAEPKTLNPLLASTTIEGFIDRLMFEPLLSADPRGNPVPLLATAVPTQENGAISKDGLTIRYGLRSHVYWSDGVPVTSHDVVWSWRAILNRDNDVVSRHGYDDVRSIETPDARTVIVHLRRPFAPFVNTFFAESDQPYDIAPAHALERVADFNHAPFNGAPTVTDGPFRFASWTRGDRIELTQNQRFFAGVPGLKSIEIQFVPNEETAINLLRTHDLDFIYQPSIQTYPALHAQHDARIVWVNANGYEGMLFNLARPVTANPLVRRAIAAAIDKTLLTQQLAHGQSKAATEDLPDWIWAFDPAVRAVPFDPAQSKRLLARAGWIAGPDNYVRKGGRPMELLLATDTQTATHRSESVLIQAALRRIGIVVQVKYYPQDVLYAPQGMGGILHGGKFDLLLFPWYSGIDPDNSSQFACEYVPPHGYDDSRYCSAAMQAAQREALTRYDRASRKRAYSRIERLLSVDNPAVFFWWQRQQEAISPDFRGFAPNPVNEAWNAWQWRI